MVVNMNMKSQDKGSINEYLSDTIADVFPCVYTVEVEAGTNRELFAFSDETALSNFGHMEGLDENLKNRLRMVQRELAEYQGGDFILTDDKAPVEVLGMRVIDGLIQEELGYYKDLFKKKGIRGIIEEGL